MSEIEQAAEILDGAKNAVVLSGAGLSAGSGMPTFREGNDALWLDNDTNRWASFDEFKRNPTAWYESFWNFYNLHTGLAPSAGHHALKDMVDASAIKSMVTQNVDSFDLLAGTPGSQTHEVHGHDRVLHCSCPFCDFRMGTEDWLAEHDPSQELPVCPEDEWNMKPDIVLYNERLRDNRIKVWRRGAKALRKASALLVVGTTLEIPAWEEAFAHTAIKRKKPAIVIDPNRTKADRFARVVIHEPAEDVLPEIRDLVVAG